MDPNTTLTEIRDVIQAYHCKERNPADLLDELADLVTALDSWMSLGNFLPDLWTNNR